MWAADPALQSYISADRKPSNSAALELNEMRFPSFRMQPTLGETFTRARSNAHLPPPSVPCTEHSRRVRGRLHCSYCTPRLSGGLAEPHWCDYICKDTLKCYFAVASATAAMKILVMSSLSAKLGQLIKHFV